MTSRQFSRPGRKQLRRTRVLRDSRLSRTWARAFFSLCAAAGAVYALSLTIAK